MRYELIRSADINRIVTVRDVSMVDDMLCRFADPALILIFKLPDELLKVLILNY